MTSNLVHGVNNDLLTNEKNIKLKQELSTNIIVKEESLATEYESLKNEMPEENKKIKLEEIYLKDEFVINKSDNIDHEQKFNAEFIIKEESFDCEQVYERQLTFNGDKQLLRDDFRTKPDIEEKNFFCEACNKTFTFKQSLIRHQVIHTGEKPFLCEVCNKTFTQQSNLNIHKRIHTGEKRFWCEICDKTFTQKCDLIKHQRTHTGEKPFTCEICNKTFSQQCSLNIHKRTHTGEKPFRCEVCNKAFTKKGNLDFHKRIHTGEKPFSCDVCNKTFSLKHVLIRHKRIHSE